MNEHICVAVNTKATGEKIRKLREKCGFSKTEVQESLGLVGVQSIYDWENGVKLPNLENALGLARLLGVDLDQLLVAQPLVKENATKTEQERSDRCRISEAVEKLEPMFADMLLEDGSASDPAATRKSSWKTEPGKSIITRYRRCWLTIPSASSGWRFVTGRTATQDFIQKKEGLSFRKRVLRMKHCCCTR